MSTESGVVVSTIDYCRNFPAEPNPKLPREQLYEQIQKTLDAHRIVVLEGESLSGKTECLADYMRRAPDNCIGIFINPDFGIFNSPAYLRLVVAEQASWILNKTPLIDESGGISETRYQQLLFKLQRHAKNQQITWLIDGLGVGRKTQGEIQEMIDLIPFGMTDFRFVISSDINPNSPLNLQNISPKELSLHNVSIEEAKSYFKDSKIKDEDIVEIRRFCNGNVGLMQKIWAFLREGISIDSLLSEREKSLERIFEFEWSRVPKTVEMQELLAYVVFSNMPATKSDLKKFLRKDDNELEALLGQCRMITLVPDNQTAIIESRAQRQFIRNHLASFEAQIRSYVINSLLEVPLSKETTLYLPSQLKDAGRYEELLKHLGPKHFLNVLKAESSLSSIKKHVSLGIKAAQETRNAFAEFSLSMIQSMASGITFSVGSVPHIEALIKLGASENALELASIAPTVEERLHLLSLAARELHSNSQAIPAELRSELKALQDMMKFEEMGDLGVDIACNLLPVDFDAASKVIARVVDGSRAKSHSNTHSELSSERQMVKGGDSEDITKGVERRELSSLPDSQARKFADAIVATVDEFSSDRILVFIKGIEDANKITVLARWLGQNREHADAHKIANIALDIVLSSDSRTPTLQDLREIAEALPYIADDAQRLNLEKRILPQVDLLEHQGTSEEYVKLNLLLSRACFERTPENVELSLIELLGKVEAIKDVSVKASCLAWMLFHLSKFKNSQRLESDISILTEVQQQLSQAISCLLSNTANQYDVASAAIFALAQSSPDEAYALVSKLNIEIARDKGYKELVRSLLHSDLNTQKLSYIRKAVERIVDNRIRVDVVITLYYSLIKKALRNTSQISAWGSVGDLWKSLRVSTGKFQAFALSHKLRKLEQGTGIDSNKLNEELTSLWNQVLAEPVKVELGYWIANELASTEKAMAQSWIAKTIEYAKEKPIPSRSVQDSLISITSLNIRILSYIEEVTEDQYKQIAYLIGTIPSVEVQLQLWTDVGIRLNYSNIKNVEYSKRIVSERLRPWLDQSYDNDGWVFDSIAAYATPLFYLTHPASALQLISRIEFDEYRDLARSNICEVLLRKIPLSERFAKPDDGAYLLDQPLLDDLVTLAKDVLTDSILLGIVEDICSSLCSKKNNTRINRNAAMDSLNSLGQIVQNNLPDKRNISHDGYLIACRAQILKAKMAVQKSLQSKSDWADLYSQARAIGNVADKVVVSAMVGSGALHAKSDGVLPANWIDEIKNDLPLIPSIQDRVSRYRWVAGIFKQTNPQIARTLISGAIKQIAQSPESDDLAQTQRQLLDMAHSIDSKLVDQLVEYYDDDEARKKQIKKESLRLGLSQSLRSQPTSSELGKISDHELAEICRTTLGQLVAGRISAKSLEEYNSFQSRAAGMPLNMSLSIWHLVVESTLRKRKADKNNNFAINLLDSTFRAAEIVCGFIGIFFRGEQHKKTLDIGIVRYGDRELFLAKLEEWAVSCNGKVIKISDPYFGPEDMEVVKVIFLNAKPDKFQILTSKEHMRKKKLIDIDIEDEFINSWRSICDEELPEIALYIVGVGSEGKHPIHDRWILSENNGLRLGTSSNSMGGGRTSEISRMDSSELVDEASMEIDRYINSPPREIGGERVQIARYLL